MSSPAPVRGSDNRFHLAHELALTNATDQPATIRSAETVSAAKPGQVLEKLSGPALASRFKLTGNFGPPTPSSEPVSLGPSQSGILYFDVSAPRVQDLPRELVHRISVSYPEASLSGVVPARVTETAGKVQVSSRPVTCRGPAPDR
ncbi:hypothetical protein [Streptomyces sp. NPDC008121]|uniref:hypothetical protein n=1 Tax=Streptomyces sp. NPDC008121 TaxID=3364809 RepID=UPI0036E8D3AC